MMDPMLPQTGISVLVAGISAEDPILMMVQAEILAPTVVLILLGVPTRNAVPTKTGLPVLGTTLLVQVAVLKLAGVPALEVVLSLQLVSALALTVLKVPYL